MRTLVVAVVVLCACVPLAGAGTPARAPDPGRVRGGLSWYPAPPGPRRYRPQPGHWTRYVLLPSRPVVCAPRVAVLPGAPVSGARSLTCDGRGGHALVRGTDGRPAQVVVDFGREMSGRLRLQLGARTSAGSVRVSYSESLNYLANCDSLAIEKLTVAPACPRTFARTNGAQEIRDPNPRSGFRYVLVATEAAGHDATLDLRGVDVFGYTGFAGRARSARRAYRGWFLSSDDAVNRYWYDGVYTAQVDTLRAKSAGSLLEGLSGRSGDARVIVDGAKRDRYVWYDLAGPKTLIPLLYGDTRTPRNTLALLAANQGPAGFMPACVLPRWDLGGTCATGWTDATPWWVIALGQYVDWSGDMGFARQEYAHMTRALQAFGHCRVPGGLFAPCNGAANYAFGGDSSPSTYLNALAVGASRAAARLARLLHHAADAIRFGRRARATSAAVNAQLWDAQAGAYRQSLGRPAAIPQDANVLGAYFGVAHGARARSALRYVKQHLWSPRGVVTGVDDSVFGNSGNHLVTDWIEFFGMLARVAHGEGADVRRMLDASAGWMYSSWKRSEGSLGTTAEPPSTTAWEHVIDDGIFFRGDESSLSHAWGAGATPVITIAALGVEPRAPGFRRWRVRPLVAGMRLRWTQGRVPTRFGPLDVSWRAGRGALRLTVDPPHGTVGEIVLPHRRLSRVRSRVTIVASR